MKTPSEARLKEIYGKHLAEAKERYTHLIQMFEERFPGQEALFFTAPGRTEIIGNHTDHNGGKILAASVDMDTICAAQKTDDRIVTIVSEGYVPVTIDLDKLDEIPTCEGTLSLTAGILEGTVRRGFQAGGFNAFVTTQVVSAAGISSSASYEMLIGTVLNTLFNDGKMKTADIARIGRYAENVWWEKASGLMDQMACGTGGCVLLDFDDRNGAGSVACEAVDFSFEPLGYDILLINTGKGHADLSAAYSSIPNEMRMVARALAGEAVPADEECNLCRFTEEALLQRLPQIREAVSNDRAILRAIHFYEETRRAEEAARAIKEGRAEIMPKLVEDSGSSSWRMLQNTFVDSEPQVQGIGVALAAAEVWLKREQAGSCRVNGGGFAGVIMCVVKKEKTADFAAYMAPFVGEESICRIAIRETGAVCIG